MEPPHGKRFTLLQRRLIPANLFISVAGPQMLARFILVCEEWGTTISSGGSAALSPGSRGSAYNRPTAEKSSPRASPDPQPSGATGGGAAKEVALSIIDKLFGDVRNIHLALFGFRGGTSCTITELADIELGAGRFRSFIPLAADYSYRKLARSVLPNVLHTHPSCRIVFE